MPSTREILLRMKFFFLWLRCVAFTGHSGSLGATVEIRLDGSMERWGHICKRCRSAYGFGRWM
jgi:hypothetical protein